MTGRDGTDGDRAATGDQVDLVDWGRTARRMRASSLILTGVVLSGWLVTGLLGDGLTAKALSAWVGAGLGALFVVELVVVGGSALRGMLRAGERGERLASDDVGLLPPRRRRSSGSEERA